MLEIDRKKKAPEPVPIGINNRLKPLRNLVLMRVSSPVAFPLRRGTQNNAPVPPDDRGIGAIIVKQ
jgi:hypothetical protein